MPDYNLAPTDPAPPWDRGGSGHPMINARGETVATSRVFGEALRQRRCLVPADGWYEWRLTGRPRSARQPFFMTRPEGVVFAGIWSPAAIGRGGASSRMVTFSIVTVPSHGELAAVHDRMPLLLEPARWNEWLHAEMFSTHSATTPSEVTQLLTPPSSAYCAAIEIRPVSAKVGDVRNDGPELVRRMAVAPPVQSTMDEQPTLFP